MKHAITFLNLLIFSLGISTPATAASPDPERELSPATSAEAEQEEPETTPPSTDENRETRARIAFQEGDRLYYEGDFEGALVSFEEAYALSGRIEMLFNLANAHERLRNYTQASVALRGYIPHAPEESRAALERRLARLEDQADAQRAQPSPTPPAPTSAAPQPGMISFDRAIGYGLAALGVVGLATGVGFAISASDARAELDALCSDGASGRVCPEEADPYVRRDKAHSIAADVSFVAGTAFAAAGIYLMIRKTDEGEIRASAGPGSLFLSGSF